MLLTRGLLLSAEAPTGQQDPLAPGSVISRGIFHESMHTHGWLFHPCA